MRNLPLVSMVILLALLALLVGGCGSSDPQQTQEFEAQPTSRFARGEAIGIVQTWLGQRPYSYTFCTQRVIIGVGCPDEAKQQRVGNCLEYVNVQGSNWSESFQGNGVSRVTQIGPRGPYAWDVYEQSRSVRTVAGSARPRPCQ